MLIQSKRTYLKIILLLLFFGVVAKIVAHLSVNILWFQELGYLSVFLKILKTKIIAGLAVFLVSYAFIVCNFNLAEKLKWHTRNPENKLSPPYKQVQSNQLKLPLLLFFLLTFILIIGVMLLYYAQVTYDIWRIDYNLPKVTPALPSPFYFSSFSAILRQIYEQIWKIIFLVLIGLSLINNCRNSLKAINLVISIIFGIVIAGNWTVILQFMAASEFSETDPMFAKDIAFYIFDLPFWQLSHFWVSGLILYSLSAVSLDYLLSGNSLARGKFPGFSRSQLRHIYGLAAGMMVSLAWRHWLNRYELVYSTRGVNYGASYTDINIQIPLEIALTIISSLIAAWLLWKAITGAGRNNLFLTQFWGRQNKLGRPLYKIPFSLVPFYIYCSVFILGIMGGLGVQSFIVEPNELERELPYIERTIAFTRRGFNLDQIEIQTFDPQDSLDYKTIQNNSLTIENIRLWDTRPLLETNRQLQQIRPYYSFANADIDRYTIKVSQDSQEKTSSEKQQVIIAARELDYNAVPEQAKTWVNKHLVYSHGYGFTLSPVNLVAEGGLPYYFVQDINITPEESALRTSSELINYSIPIGKPRIYYGELTDNYIMTPSKVQELDFPSGQENVYNVYDGTGGINLASYWRRLLFAIDLQDWQMLFTENFTPETKLLWRRNLNRRVRIIAPFLRYDEDPYLVVADGGDANQGGSLNYLHWILDAYTTSNHYPYSDPRRYKFNYIRNSVKVVLDAYHGDVQFYVADPTDPIIQTWQKIFGELFLPLQAMPPSLRSHIRYPQDLFQTQSELLLGYHMLDPQVFYNREDQWRIPKEIYGSESQAVEPYYLIMKLSNSPNEQFILVNLYTPRSRNNLIAILFGLSDAQEYGKLLLYTLPKQRLVYGTEQIEARINQDPVISQQISLWNRDGSRVVQGNLLAIPIENSLLYVEPLYLEATQNSIPTLIRVILVYENRIVMAESLNQGFQGLFEAQPEDVTPIIRPLEESDVQS